jgi:hypothetical protein
MSFPLSITDDQRNNLAILSSHLKKVDKKKFNMSYYCVKKYHGGMFSQRLFPYNIVQEYNECDTVACALGHAPMAGIPVYGNEDWIEYSGRVFGINNNSDFNPRAWSWLFQYRWVAKDNTPKGAAARIDWLLENNIPEDYNQQMLDSNYPLSYKVEA